MLVRLKEQLASGVPVVCVRLGDRQMGNKGKREAIARRQEE